ncbi:ultraviolet-B receptor UVR8-like [Xenia sp. Carnegie-2017]|uniref:ultraviolet-B receptor UVR8-like n=1 Tax=Xenia sp. Carnegie-2017 TaxID=2897299 RepID=UPI001F0499E7|nr:ultraviolet-B receptor UVR8-like [Xenia sp. Carnegie-2017]
MINGSNGNLCQVSGDVVNALSEMSKGAYMLMVEKENERRFRNIFLAKDLKSIHWHASKILREESSDQVSVSAISKVLEGKQSSNVRYIKIPDDYKALSILLLCNVNNEERSIVFVCEDRKQYELWLAGFQALKKGIENSELLHEILNDEEEHSVSVKSIVSNLERNSSQKDSDNNAVVNAGSSMTFTQQSAKICDLYTWGNGKHSKLGHGEETEEYKPKIVNALSRLRIKLVACGTNHMLCVTVLIIISLILELFNLNSNTTNCMWEKTWIRVRRFWGAGSKGQLGQGHLRDRFTPLRIEELQQHNVIQISCNTFHSTAVTDEGKLFTWGYGSLELGYETVNKKQLTPKLVQSLSSVTVVRASCGKDFTLACTNEGQLYAFGNNRYYQLGLGDNDSHREPTIIQFNNMKNESIVKMDCGDYHSAAISDGGNIWLWGENRFGQLGTEDFFTVGKPFNLQLHENDNSNDFLTDVSCGSRHTAIVTFRGAVYCFGDNALSQLGRKNATDVTSYNKPEKVKFSSKVKIKTVSCGVSHTAALTAKGDIFTWGYGYAGMLGHGDVLPRAQPTQIFECFEGKRVLTVSCGAYHTACTAEIRPPGSLVRNCMGCLRRFPRIMPARCTCSNCGGTFCATCAPKRPQRLCDKCYRNIQEET